MRCIVKKCRVLLLAAAIAAGQTGCGSKAVLEQKYNTFITTEKYGIGASETLTDTSFFAKDLCVGGNENLLDDSVSEGLSAAAGLFDVTDRDILYARNLHERLYPASTTKILTAYLALKYGDLNASATVSSEALNLDSGSSTCGLSVGDTLTLEQLLYGLLMSSGNDAANVIAETVSGSQEEFVNLMNREALSLGATNSHFVNAHGLHDEQQYTTVYDLYLFFRAALSNELFAQIINTKEYTANYTNRKGETVTKNWKTTNRYLAGEKETPENITVLGGKTGTTFDAGYCLVLYSQANTGHNYISIVLKAESRDNLYTQMTELLKKISN